LNNNQTTKKKHKKKIDVSATPRPGLGLVKRALSGRTMRLAAALGGKFPPEALPSSMLPRDLAKLQAAYPAAPTSLLQATCNRLY